jgi:mono/diheme cytochrome c family protein
MNMSQCNQSEQSRGAAIRRTTITLSGFRFLAAAAVILLLWGTIPLMGQSGSREQTQETGVVAARTFVLQDANGQERGELSIKEGVPCLSLLDKNGTCRMRLSIRSDGSPAITLFDANGRESGLFRVDIDGEPGLVGNGAPATDATDTAAGTATSDEGPEEATVTAAAEPARPSPAATALFSQHCASCHGEDGSGADGRSEMPRLPDFRRAAWQSFRPDAVLLASIINGRGTEMPPFQGELTAAQAREVLGVVRAFGPERRPTADVAAGDFNSRFQELEREFEELERRIQSLQSARVQR